MAFITDDFVSSYAAQTPPWGFGGMGEVVFLRSFEVPPGRYQCVAVEAAAANQINFHDPAVWQKLGSWVRTVTLAPGENPKMALTPAPVSALR